MNMELIERLRAIIGADGSKYECCLSIKEVSSVIDALEALEAENKRLRKALKPLTYDYVVNRLLDPIIQDGELEDGATVWITIRCGEIRDAVAALSKTEGEGNG
jgi:hypothetical protein